MVPAPKEKDAIELARKSLGDFKLKTGSDYIVPEVLTLNVVLPCCRNEFSLECRQFKLLAWLTFSASVQAERITFESKLHQLNVLDYYWTQKCENFNQQLAAAKQLKEHLEGEAVVLQVAPSDAVPIFQRILFCLCNLFCCNVSILVFVQYLAMLC